MSDINNYSMSKEIYRIYGREDQKKFVPMSTIQEESVKKSIAQQ